MTGLFMTRFPLWLALTFALLLAMGGAARAQEQEERRVAVGFRLFPAVLAADEKIRDKASEDGALLLLLLHLNQPHQAQRLARDLTAQGALQGMPLRVEVLPVQELEQHAQRPVAGIFLVQPMDVELPRVIGFGRDRRAIVFSPFPGDVTAGVAAGISVTDRVLPLLNRAALAAAGITIKPFFLGVALDHEP